MTKREALKLFQDKKVRTDGMTNRKSGIFP